MGTSSRQAAPEPVGNACTNDSPMVACCACCIKPCVLAALQLVDKELDEIIARKMAAQAPTSTAMARDGDNGQGGQYSAPAAGRIPKPPPLENFQTWLRAKAAITIQKHQRGRATKIAVIVRSGLEKMPAASKARVLALKDTSGHATSTSTETLDIISAAVVDALGKNVWARAIFNAPNEWDEKQMVATMLDVIANPASSSHLWVLTKPTKHERALLGLSTTVANKRERSREVQAAVRIQTLFRGRSKRLQVMVRFQLEGMATSVRAKAVADGFDAIADLIASAMGKNVWARAVHNAPDEWEEEQMLFAMTDALYAPTTSGYLWLLAKPTKHERMLLGAFSPAKAHLKAFNANL